MKFRGIQIGEGFHFKLCGAPAEKGTFAAQYFFFHKAQGRAAKDQVEFAVFPVMVKQMLQARRDGAVRFGKVGEFVNDKHNPFGLHDSGDFCKGVVKRVIDRGRAGIWIPICTDGFGEGSQVIFCIGV